MPHPDTHRILDAEFPMRGECMFCGRWARHRIADAIRGISRAGHTPEQIQAEYPHVPLEAIRVLVSLNGPAYGWWLRSEGARGKE